MLGLNRLLLLYDGDNVALQHPVVLLHPLRQLLVVDVSKEFRKVNFVDGLECGPNDVTDESTN